MGELFCAKLDLPWSKTNLNQMNFCVLSTYITRIKYSASPFHHHYHHGYRYTLLQFFFTKWKYDILWIFIYQPPKGKHFLNIFKYFKWNLTFTSLILITLKKATSIRVRSKFVTHLKTRNIGTYFKKIENRLKMMI